MCLSTIDKKTKDWKVGYKVFTLQDKKLFPIYYGTTIPFEENKWIRDINNSFIEIKDNEKYKTGFHFFRYKKDAKIFVTYRSSRVIRKVKVRSLTATGTQGISETGVAKEIFITGEE